MAAVTPARTGDRKLHLREVLEWMVEDGILDSGTAQKKYLYAKARRNWQARAAYSAGATNPPSPFTGRS